MGLSTERTVNPHLTFNPFDPIQRQQVRALLDALDAAPPATDPQPAQDAAKGTDAVLQELPKLLRLSSGELLRLAVQNFGPGVPFDLKELAQRSGKDVETIFSRNRTLAHSCEKRGIPKAAVLEEHGGSPRRFSVPVAVHAEVRRLLAEQAQEAGNAVPTLSSLVTEQEEREDD